MKTQACDPCAKRKVRCDRNEPCSNCKRRKQDHCTYADISPAEKIKLLEAQVRSLGGDPSNLIQAGGTLAEASQRPSTNQEQGGIRINQTPTRHIGPKATDPVLREEEGQLFYLESHAWQNWLGQDYRHGAFHEKPIKRSFLIRKHPTALQSLLGARDSINITKKLPSKINAAELWTVFYQRVNPLIRISFSWELQRLQQASSGVEQQEQLSNAECTFLSSLYLLSVVSLSEEECHERLGRSKTLLISEMEALFEEALSCVGLLCVSDITVLKALTMYIMAGADRLSTQSLWSLMGLVIRNAEKLGIHRDGTLLGLSPAETEERRRLWWHLQHLDLGLAVRSGLTSLTLVADWDAKLPLNIEDDDINPTMTEFPQERRGLTSMAYCQFAYWILDEQRRFFRVDKGRFELSWQSNPVLPQAFKDSLIDQLEDKINRNFLQYCDPIRSLDTLLQILARFLICGMRMRSLHPFVSTGNLEDADLEKRRALLSFAMQCLEYDLALASQVNLKSFQWWTKGWFSWHAFMIVIVESAHQTDTTQAQRIWNLLADIYSSFPSLAELSEDRRSAQAAELVVSAWKAYRAKSSPNHLPIQPALIVDLEARLERCRTKGGQSVSEGNSQKRDDPTGEALPHHADTMTETSLTSMYDLEFQDIDWLLWENLD